MSRMLVFIEDGFEEIEAITVVDILRRADMEVAVVSSKETPTGAHGVTILRDADVNTVNYSGYDAIFLPGGIPGADNLFALPKVGEVLDDFHARGKLVVAICAAPYVLGLRGMLKGRKATCYPHETFIDRLQGAIYVEEPVVLDGNIMTSQGPGTAGKLGYAIVDYLHGDGASRSLRKEMLAG